jgi:hypothetical protein
MQSATGPACLIAQTSHYFDCTPVRSSPASKKIMMPRTFSRNRHASTLHHVAQRVEIDVGARVDTHQRLA